MFQMLSRNLKVRKYILKDLGETTYHSLCSKLTLIITNIKKMIHLLQCVRLYVMK